MFGGFNPLAGKSFVETNVFEISSLAIDGFNPLAGKSFVETKT